ncbi:MAG TPA: 16S rRNA (guanine(966)-N(2))-methyltransferase RsmD [Myxococcota bacterium]|nr:16S rRNA (guanine(966)-N(2))-methyltransferase RsmD [Myxococcota bacterium]
MRVVAGELRGRRLLAASGRETRPTSERARAGLFDWLGPRVADARVLDLFAGTGALGIEALSRGARSAVFVERARPALRALRSNLAELELESRAQVVERDLARGLGSRVVEGGAYDLVLADPPYEGGWLARLLACETLPTLLPPDAVVIVERSVRAPAAPGSGRLQYGGSKRYGETAFDWYENAAEGGEQGRADS